MYPPFFKMMKMGSKRCGWWRHLKTERRLVALVGSFCTQNATKNGFGRWYRRNTKKEDRIISKTLCSIELAELNDRAGKGAVRTSGVEIRLGGRRGIRAAICF
jgi:hypothetical protein